MARLRQPPRGETSLDAQLSTSRIGKVPQQLRADSASATSPLPNEDEGVIHDSTESEENTHYAVEVADQLCAEKIHNGWKVWPWDLLDNRNPSKFSKGLLEAIKALMNSGCHVDMARTLIEKEILERIDGKAKGVKRHVWIIARDVRAARVKYREFMQAKV